MNTKILTRAAILSALMVMIGIISLGTGVGYTLYLDGVVPIMTVMIYLCCGMKLTLLATLNALLMTFFFGET